MSAYGYKRTFQGVRQRVRFTPESRHSNREIPTVPSGCPLYPQERTSHLFLDQPVDELNGRCAALQHAVPELSSSTSGRAPSCQCLRMPKVTLKEKLSGRL